MVVTSAARGIGRAVALAFAAAGASVASRRASMTGEWNKARSALVPS